MEREKPKYKYVSINGENVKVKIKSNIPKGYTFLCKVDGFSLYEKVNVLGKTEYCLY
jgi:hypothetical protein